MCERESKSSFVCCGGRKYVENLGARHHQLLLVWGVVAYFRRPGSFFYLFVGGGGGDVGVGVDVFRLRPTVTWYA